MTSFFIADLHFGDETLTMCDGAARTSARPFLNAAEMDSALIKNWNEVVAEADLVWVLGDVGRPAHFRKIAALRGRKRLVVGNRDPISDIVRRGLFDEIHAVKLLPGLVLSHVPLHSSQVPKRVCNVHGHLHRRALPDRRYVCVSADRTGFRPVRREDLLGLASRYAGGTRSADGNPSPAATRSPV